MRKKPILKAMRDQVWVQNMGKVYEGKCKTSWCVNIINVTNFQCGHNIPESKGGETNLANLVPICSSCNQSMGNRFTFDEWDHCSTVKAPWWCCSA